MIFLLSTLKNFHHSNVKTLHLIWVPSIILYISIILFVTLFYLGESEHKRPIKDAYLLRGAWTDLFLSSYSVRIFSIYKIQK